MNDDKDVCICGEINARHCPVHQGTKQTPEEADSGKMNEADTYAFYLEVKVAELEKDRDSLRAWKASKDIYCDQIEKEMGREISYLEVERDAALIREEKLVRALKAIEEIINYCLGPTRDVKTGHLEEAEQVAFHALTEHAKAKEEKL